MSENGKIQGSVKWYNEAKGYGFIRPDDGSRDVFVHGNELRLAGITRPLKDGERINFTLGSRDKGPFAKEVSLGGHK